MPTRIPVEELQVGMTVLAEKPNGSFVTDVVLARYFTTSVRFPTISFVTSSGALVKWHRCGHVWIR